MKSITLINPDKAQEVFLNNTWNDCTFNIKCIGLSGDELLVNAETFKINLSAVSLKVILGEEFEIPLEEFGFEITLELKDIKDLGALLLINNLPYLLSVYNTTLENSIGQIGARFPSLRIADFGSGKNEHIESLDCIFACKQLHTLNLSYCENLVYLSPLSDLTKLTNLDLSSCYSLSDISPLSGLTALTNLNLSGCENLSDISPLSSLTALTNLKLSFNSNLCPLSGLINLTHLDLGLCENLIDISPLSDLIALTNLDLSSCYNLNDLSPLTGLTALKDLDLSACKNLSDIRPLSGLTALTNLDLSRCENLSDISPLSRLTALTNLKLTRCKNIFDISPLSGLTALTYLNLSSAYIMPYTSDISPLSGLTALTNLKLSSCSNIIDINPLSGLTALTNLELDSCFNLSDISPLSGLSSLLNLDLSNCEKLTKVDKISKLTSLKELHLGGSPIIRDFDRLETLPNLLELSWIDPIACNEILMSSAYNRKDVGFVNSRSAQWIKELPLSKDAILFTSRLLNCISLLEASEINSVLKEVCKVMRARGLESELLNDLDAYIWETWCNLVLELDVAQSMECLHAAISDLDFKRETEVLLGPVILAASEFIQKHPTEKEKTITWVNEQLLQLEIHPEEQRQIAPSAAVFFASLNKKEEVLFWLQKATNEKAPLWREKVLLALVNYYAGQTNYTEARRLLDEMQMQEEKDKAIAALAKFMAATHPIDAGFLLDDIHEEAISTEAARNMLQQLAMLREPQGIYQLLLHLQSNPDELASTLETMISKDKNGQLAAAVKQLFLQAQTAGPSATVLLELCKHPSILDFVKPRALEKYKAQLQERALQELSTMVPNLISEMQEEDMIDGEEALELTQLMQHK